MDELNSDTLLYISKSMTLEMIEEFGCGDLLHVRTHIIVGI